MEGNVVITFGKLKVPGFESNAPYSGHITLGWCSRFDLVLTHLPLLGPALIRLKDADAFIDLGSRPRL